MPAKSHERLIEEIGAMTVLEVADLVKALEEAFGVSAAAMAVAAPAAAAAAAPQEEKKSAYKVTLESVDAGKKIDTIKALREAISGLSLGDAKKMFEEAPAVVSESMAADDAEKFKKKMESGLGAKVSLA